jgi:peroxin-6
MGKPPIPTAISVTLAIIASPFSCEEPYRSILVEHLKSNLEGSARLIKRGDIICVGIDTSALRSFDGLDRGVLEEDVVQIR